jgi:hypothetical protein
MNTKQMSKIRNKAKEINSALKTPYSTYNYK